MARSYYPEIQVKLAVLEERQEDMKNTLGTIQKSLDSICADLKGNGKTSGYFEQVRNNSRFRKNFNKMFWILLAAIVGDIISKFI